MPGLRFFTVPEMQQNTFSKSHQRSFRLSGKRVAANDLQNLSNRLRRTTDPSTPENEPIQNRAVGALPGNLIHLSQSADGKLRWLPPSSSSSSSLNEGTAFSGCFSGDCGPIANIGLAFTRTSRKKYLTACRESNSKEQKKEMSSEAAGPASPSLASCCRNHVASDSSIIQSSETVNDSDLQEPSFGSHRVVPSSSDLSISSQQQDVTSGGKNLLAGLRDSSSTRSCGLSPYLSSKLKPGKHILGVKKQQVFIRPGQLRHWAVGNSPSLASNLANLPATSLKGNACRTLAF